MLEVTIIYSSPKTLKVLKALSELLDFKLTKSEKVKGQSLDIITIPSRIPGDKTVDISDMSDVFSRSKMDAKKLRKEAWGRKK